MNTARNKIHSGLRLMRFEIMKCFVRLSPLAVCRHFCDPTVTSGLTQGLLLLLGLSSQPPVLPCALLRFLQSALSSAKPPETQSAEGADDGPGSIPSESVSQEGGGCGHMVLLELWPIHFAFLFLFFFFKYYFLYVQLLFRFQF